MVVMDNVELTANDGGDNRSCEKLSGLVGNDSCEEYRCILWYLAASKTRSEFVVQNLVLEVLLENLMIPQSVCVRESHISMLLLTSRNYAWNIIGNLACLKCLANTQPL
ncbi:hypothetical protein U1Q18_011372 [Sarracenia purpurea var. burkii]